jgi:hypothetical protein
MRACLMRCSVSLLLGLTLRRCCPRSGSILRDVRPILERRFRCHGPKRQEAGSASTAQHAIAGGDSGQCSRAAATIVSN